MLYYEVAMMIGMPVYKMMDEMPYSELLGWFEYIRRRPMGWRDDQRAAMMMAPHMGKGFEPTKVFPSLETIYKEQRGIEAFEKKRVRTSPFIQMLKQAASREGQSDWLDFIEE